jgi:hypothetical protein
MTERSPVGRRLAGALFGVERPGHGPREVAARSSLPFGRRLLAAVLGVRVSAQAREVPGIVEPATERTTWAKPVAGRGHGAVRSAERPLREAARSGFPEPEGVQEPEGLPEPERLQEARQRQAPQRTYTSSGTVGVPQHLLSEDRQDYERLLDDALRSAPHRPDLAAVGQRLNPEQLRTMALNATPLITAAAATEYRHYVLVREVLRRPAPSTPPVHGSTTGSPEPDADGLGLAASVGETAAGAGAGAVIAVLAPVLAGTAAAIFLLVGYILKMVNPGQAFARSLLTTGWVLAGVTAAAILVAAIGLLLTALRQSSSNRGTGAPGGSSAEVARAREAWHEALLERGILPFLREALGDSGTASMPRTAPVGRVPRLGYDRPGFSSPDSDPAADPRPSFTSPDVTSPDFGGPDPADAETQSD